MQKRSQADKQELVGQSGCDKIDTVVEKSTEQSCQNQSNTGQRKEYEPTEQFGTRHVENSEAVSGILVNGESNEILDVDSMSDGDADSIGCSDGNQIASSLDAMDQVDDIKFGGDCKNNKNSSENLLKSYGEVSGKVIQSKEQEKFSTDEEKETDEKQVTSHDFCRSTSKENNSEVDELSKNENSSEIKTSVSQMLSYEMGVFIILILHSFKKVTSFLKQQLLFSKEMGLFKWPYQMGCTEIIVFAVPYRSLLDLPVPYLPGICRINHQQGNYQFAGVEYREDIEILQIEANEGNNAPHIHEHRMNILGDDNGHSHCENEDGVARNIRPQELEAIRERSQLLNNDDQALQASDVPSCGDEAFKHPHRKVSKTAMQNWSQTGQAISQDGRRSELSLAQNTSRFSHSVSTVAAPPDMRRRCERIRTFNNHWPHRHLSAEEMAKCGFYYEGSGDEVCCDWCGVHFSMWEKDDDPLVEHIRLSPNCVYAQRLLENGHVDQEDNEATLMSSSYLTEDWELGESLQAAEDSFEEGERRHSTAEQTEGETRMFQIDFESGHRPDRHSEQQNDDLNRDSETVWGLSNEIPRLSMEETNYIPGNVSSRGDIAIGQQYHSNPISGRQGARYQRVRAGPYNRTMGTYRGQGATGRNAGTLDDILESDVVKVVLSEGYRRTAVARAVQDLLRVGGSITADSIRQQLIRNGRK